MGKYQDNIEKAALGNKEAQFAIGNAYYEGDGIGQDDVKAVQWYLRSANQEHVGAQCKLGWMYEIGRGVLKDDIKSAQWYQKAAIHGHTYAQNKIGVRYKRGIGVPQSDAEAAKFFQKAADQDYAIGQYNLALMYKDGRGVPQDDAKALELFQKSSDQGYTKAQINLNWMKKAELDVAKRIPAAQADIQKIAMQLAQQEDQLTNMLALLTVQGSSSSSATTTPIISKGKVQQPKTRKENIANTIYIEGNTISLALTQIEKTKRSAVNALLISYAENCDREGIKRNLNGYIIALTFTSTQLLDGLRDKLVNTLELSPHVKLNL